MNMRKFFKLAAVGAVVGAGLLSQAALADTVSPITGNGELVLYATYSVTSGSTTNVFSYARGTGVQINAVNGGSNAALAADATYAPGKNLSMSFGGPLTADANMTTFLANAAAAGQSVSWAVLAGDDTGGGFNAGDNRWLSTSPTNFGSAVIPLNNSAIVAEMDNLSSMQVDLNTAIATGVPLDKASTLNGGQYGQGLYSNAADWFGAPFANSNLKGTSQSFYLLTGGNGAPIFKARDYLVGVFTMDAAGNLSFTSAGTGAVPLPAAVWLFGSGLLGLAGVGRRKRVA
jgi:hypothetical protein